MRDLNRYGGGCRCLLRARENEGKPGLSDAAFFARFGPRYPEWEDQPGATDAYGLLDLARGLGLAGRMELSRDYDRVLRAHRAGHLVLLSTERAPTPADSPAPSEPQTFTLLLVTMETDTFRAWCPFPSGQAEELPPASRRDWDRWFVTGILLHRPAAAR